MSQQCPLIFRQVDATVIRINTLFVMCGVILFLVTQQSFILAFLIADLSVRLYGAKHLSPIQNASLMIQKRFSFPVKMEDAGAKRLAAFFGIGFLSAILLFHLIGLIWAVYVTAAVLLSCATLEAAFGFCIACKLYYLIKAVYPKGFE